MSEIRSSIVTRLRKRWSPRRFAIYILATAFGGSVLILLLVLLHMLYWMEVPVDLPPPGRLIHADSSAYLVISIPPADSAPRFVPAGAAKLFSDETPTQIERLIDKGIDKPDCPVQIVAALVPGENGEHTTLAVSLGHYPGMFWLVRRDLVRRFKRGELDASLEDHDGVPLFVTESAGKLSSVLAIAESSVFRTSDEQIVKELIDRLDEGAELPAEIPDPLAIAPSPGATAALLGWAKDFEHASFHALLPTGPARSVEEFRSRLSKDVPAVAQIRDIRFHGNLQGPDRLELTFSFQLQDDTQPDVLAKRLSDWLRSPSAGIGIQAAESRSRDGRAEIAIEIDLAEAVRPPAGRPAEAVKPRATRP